MFGRRTHRGVTQEPPPQRPAPSWAGALDVNHTLPSATAAAAAAAALATPSHLCSRDVTLPVNEVQIAALLLDAYFCDFFCHETSPPLLTVSGYTAVAAPGCGNETLAQPFIRSSVHLLLKDERLS